MTEPTTQLISIRGATENNLKNIDCDLPRQQLVVVTGPSGAGKSSLVFGTIHREAERRFGRADTPARVKSLRGLSFSVSVTARRFFTGTPFAVLSGIFEPLRILFAQFAARHCIACGTELKASSRVEIAREIERAAVGRELTVLAPVTAAHLAQSRGYSRVRIDGTESAIEQLVEGSLSSAQEIFVLLDRFTVAESRSARLHEAIRNALELSGGVMRYEYQDSAGEDIGVYANETLRCSNCGLVQTVLHPQDFLLPVSRRATCPAVFREEVLRLSLAGASFKELYYGTIDRLSQWSDTFSARSCNASAERRLLDELLGRITFLRQLGLGYLELSRPASTLSAGEAQKAQLVRWFGVGFKGVTYLLDEPTLGLHPRDIDSLIALLTSLRDCGNSVIVVEHDSQVLAAADYVLTLGPKGGEQGGQVVAAGELVVSDEPPALAEAALNQTKPAAVSGSHLILSGATANNLKHVDCSLPLTSLVVIAGASGSGKSTLLTQTLLPALSRAVEHQRTKTPAALSFDDLSLLGLSGWEKIRRVVDATRFRKANRGRSTVATASGVLTALRHIFALLPEAKSLGLDARAFSYFHPLGGCPRCSGRGEIRSQMGEYRICLDCSGQRYRPELADILYRGMSIADLLQLSVSEALVRFRPLYKVKQPLALLNEFGLGYLRLGQPTHTLSLGELQRLRLVAALGEGEARGSLFFFDEASRGLSALEVALLLSLLRRLVIEGASVLMIEHSLDVIRAADFLIELGPGAGVEGGAVIAQGTPQEVKQDRKSVIAAYL